MREWNYTADHPVRLTIASDARLTPTDYTNDQIWELNLGNSEPPAITLQTTYGLRARSCRIFPRFIINGETVNNPAHFHHSITIHHYFPNYINLSFRPFSSINVTLEYWVPDSHSIACRTKMVNTSREGCQIQVEWVELLVPAEDGNRMSSTEIGVTTILSGQTANLTPVFFLTGGAQPGKSPYPSLNLSYNLSSHGEQSLYWAQASLKEMNASYEQAKEIINKNWDTEFARIKRMNSQRMELFTGNQDWDSAFYLAQTLVDQLLIHPDLKIDAISYVSSRTPDQGFSLLQDGFDYNYTWNGQTAHAAYYLTNFLFPSSTEIFKGVLDNFFASQAIHGELDNKPGIGGQRSHILATPLLAQMTWLYYQYTGSQEYLHNTFPKLLAFFLSWFTPAHDRDNDSIPEWDQVIQTGHEDHPLFSILGDVSGGLEISTVESPDLCSYLFRECQSLILIAREIGDTEPITRLESVRDNLMATVDQSWDDSRACFLYRDRDSHLTTTAEVIGRRSGTGTIEIHREFRPPVRPTIQFFSQKEGTRPVQLYIHGTGPSGTHRVDHISTDQIHWNIKGGHLTCEFIYEFIEHIEVTGLVPGDELVVHASDLNHIDQTLLLPLWAGIPTDQRAKILINLTIMNKKKFLSAYGLKSSFDYPNLSENVEYYEAMYIPWICLILEGMIDYGERKKAAEIFTRWMKSVAHSIKSDLAFHQLYNPESGKPLGATNTLTSIIPIGLFLDILGVKILSSTKVEITGSNPFPWSVTIKYHGLTVVHQEKKTLVIFSDGQNLTVDNSHPQVINFSE